MNNITVILIVILCIQYTNHISMHFSFINFSDKHQITVKSDRNETAALFVLYAVT